MRQAPAVRYILVRLTLVAETAERAEIAFAQKLGQSKPASPFTFGYTDPMRTVFPFTG
jgi:hypothetical protein